MTRKTIIIIGPCGSGKTTLLEQLSQRKSLDSPSPTVGVDIATIYTDETTYRFWEISGQQRFNFLLPCYLENADAVILLINQVTSPADDIRFWLKEYHKHVDKQPILAIIHNINKRDNSDCKTLLAKDDVAVLEVDNLTKLNINTITRTLFPLPATEPAKHTSFFSKKVKEKPKRFQLSQHQAIDSCFKTFLKRYPRDIRVKKIYQGFLRFEYQALSDIISDIDGLSFLGNHPLSEVLYQLMPSIEMKQYP